MAASFEFSLDLTSTILTASEQLAVQVRDAVDAGTLRDGDLLPTLEAARRTLGVSRNKVQRAYEELKEEGIVLVIPGVGTMVTCAKPSADGGQRPGPPVVVGGIEFRLDRQAVSTTAEQIAEQIREAVQAGALREGDPLPTMRALANGLEVHANTVLKAYKQLKQEGTIKTRAGVGTMVGGGSARVNPGADMEQPRGPVVVGGVEFQLDGGSGRIPSQQIAQALKDAIRLGTLRANVPLPTIAALASALGVNSNTVLKAYHGLQWDGLVTARPGVGTFVSEGGAAGSLGAHEELRHDLETWLAGARAASVDEETIVALFHATLRGAAKDGASP